MCPRAGALILLLASCATATLPAAGGAPSGRQWVLLLPPAALGRELALAQQLRFTWAGQSQVVDAVVEADAAALTVAFLVAGQRVAWLTWDGAVMSWELSRGAPSALVAPAVISDLQLTHWPAAAILEALPGGVTLEEAPGVRRLSAGGRALVEVRTEGGRTVISNTALGYVLEVTTAPPAAGGAPP